MITDSGLAVFREAYEYVVVAVE